MKRSRALNTIKDALYCHLPGYKECPDFIAEAVLQSLEGIGMTPPPYPSLTVPHFASTLHFEWEPEYRPDTGAVAPDDKGA